MSCICSFFFTLVPVSKSVHTEGFHLNTFAILIITSSKTVFRFTSNENVFFRYHGYVITLIEMYTSVTHIRPQMCVYMCV